MPIDFNQVMDEQLAAKLQQEEDERWMRTFARQHVGFCFVEVPSENADEYGIMSVVEQEITIDEDVDDPDYAFALELQAQEAEEYDRLRRQEAASMERVRVIQQDLPQAEEIRQFISTASSSRRSLQNLSISEDDNVEHDYDSDTVGGNRFRTRSGRSAPAPSVHRHGQSHSQPHSRGHVDSSGSSELPKGKADVESETREDESTDLAGKEEEEEACERDIDVSDSKTEDNGTAAPAAVSGQASTDGRTASKASTLTSITMLHVPVDKPRSGVDRTAAPTAIQTAPRALQTATEDDDDWDNADGVANAFGNLRLMPPPPSQDGGSFERPNYTAARAGAPFDGQPVSPATASAASAQNGPLDPVLIAALENSRERLTLLKFEDQIIRFIRTPRETQLVFPPLSSYHRLIIHRLAQRCFLEHQTSEHVPYAQQGYDGNASRVVTLFRTLHTMVPRVLLIDLASDRQQAVTPASAPKIMIRKRGPARAGNDTRAGTNTDNKSQRSMQDRERAYAEARARIFGEDNNSNNSNASTTSNNRSESASSGPSLGSHQASGPDGTKGFGRGRGKDADTKGSSNSNGSSNDRGKSPKGNDDRSEDVPLTKTQNWKESRVLWRNREQELNDPDFTRNHDAYRPNYNNAQREQGGGGYGGRFANAPVRQYAPPPPQMDYYDPAMQHRGGYGFPPNGQPPLPGRRTMHPGEYSRLDNVRPPPPPDYYRNSAPHHLAPPPPQVPVGRPYRYSPQGRGGYHAVPGRPMPRAEHAGGVYNEEFPPLGK
ncbi:TPA: hypothetical protein N0F65_004453 [Lagenidium giganteum]|uniref:R3H domain-containing protein n=1 Tax=Lagenidium giganteum TaxID=4803 RepID=A0AAV2ZFE6_9STRA|nr:TPA: hypothetical protein N0F65_004453 [Lagenidium giganteum]